MSKNRFDASPLCTKAIFAAAVTAALPLLLVAPGKATRRRKAPFTGVNFAHRGLHTRDRSVPENSLEAFRLAAQAGYGIELDVQLSKDGQVVVFHDDTLDRVCSFHGKVCELSYDELKQLSLCSTRFTVPLFTDVLNVIGGKGALIVELKSGNRNRELCEKTYRILEDYRGDVCIESFDPRIVFWFKKHAPDLIRGQLAQPYKSYANEVSPAMAFLLSHGLTNILTRPHFMAYKIGREPLILRSFYAMGGLRIGWTSHEPANEKGRDGVIFEFYKPKQQYR